MTMPDRIRAAARKAAQLCALLMDKTRLPLVFKANRLTGPQ